MHVNVVEESAEAPHFLNKRKGCHVRTDEYSQRFETQLATAEEIGFLLGRRQQAVKRRQFLQERADKRSRTALARAADGVDTGRLVLSACGVPRSPGTWMAGRSSLRGFAVDLGRRRAGRGCLSQAGGLLRVDSSERESAYLEFDQEGLGFYQTRATLTTWETHPEPYVHLGWAFGGVIRCLRDCAQFLRAVGYNGTLNVGVTLTAPDGAEFSPPWLGRPNMSTFYAPPLDGPIGVELQTTAEELSTDRAAALRELYRSLAFAAGVSDAFEPQDETVDGWIATACNCISWRTTDGGEASHVMPG
jgi:hypothetical protein